MTETDDARAGAVPDPFGAPGPQPLPAYRNEFEPVAAQDEPVVDPDRSPWADAFEALAMLVIVAQIAGWAGWTALYVVTVRDAERLRWFFTDPGPVTSHAITLCIVVAAGFVLAGRPRPAAVALVASIAGIGLNLAVYASGRDDLDRYANPGLLAVAVLTQGLASTTLLAVSAIALGNARRGRRGVDLWGLVPLLVTTVFLSGMRALGAWSQFERGGSSLGMLAVLDLLVRVLPLVVAVAVMWPGIRTRTARRPLRLVLLVAGTFWAVFPHLVIDGPFLRSAYATVRFGPPSSEVTTTAVVVLVADLVVFASAVLVTVLLLRRRPPAPAPPSRPTPAPAPVGSPPDRSPDPRWAPARSTDDVARRDVHPP